jgi:hypothetical protein
VPIADKPQYATAMLQGADSMAHQVLLEREGDDWKCIGWWVDDTITIHPDLEGRGLATELFLRAVEHRTLPLAKAFTQRGHNLVRRAHKLAVERARHAGLDVPAAVLGEYKILEVDTPITQSDAVSSS